MISYTNITLKAFLISFHPKTNVQFQNLLIPSKVQALGAINFFETPKLDLLFSIKDQLSKVHYSWFLSFLETLGGETASRFLPLFADDEKKELMKLLSVTSIKEMPSFLCPFLGSILMGKIGLNEVLPRSFLSFSELNAIFSLTKKELVLMIDLLGIYDLAHELKQVVDKNTINKIHGALSSQDLKFLEYAMKQPAKWIPPKLNLNSWDGDAKKLNTLLHYRGLYRISQATFEENESFKWHICHQLDVGRGSALMKLYAGKSDPAMIPYFKRQVIDLIQRLAR